MPTKQEEAAFRSMYLEMYSAYTSDTESPHVWTWDFEKRFGISRASCYVWRKRLELPPLRADAESLSAEVETLREELTEVRKELEDVRQDRDAARDLLREATRRLQELRNDVETPEGT